MQFAARFMFQAALLLHAAHDAKLYTWGHGVQGSSLKSGQIFN